MQLRTERNPYSPENSEKKGEWVEITLRRYIELIREEIENFAVSAN
ncbi:hypothetical protein GYA19_00395 [Candidatus Beckwithbacteria bacterium]|nr:hypothetical protein [Candidatus Beckwithbacteria bacterium]